MQIRSWEKIGTWLFLLGWVLVIAYGFAPLWQGKQLQKISNPAATGVLITDLPGGDAFAFHQKSKQGDVPRVLALTDMPISGFLILLSWRFDWKIDNRWSPCLLQYDGMEFRYASGEQTPVRRGTADGKSVPTTLVMRLPGQGNLDERVYSISKDTRYYVLLPQNAALGSELYSLELRNRQTGAAPPTYLLIVGFAALLGAVLILIKHSRNSQAKRDPIEAARVYARWKRFAQARQVLMDAIKRQPHRRIEFELEIREIEALEKGIRKKQ